MSIEVMAPLGRAEAFIIACLWDYFSMKELEWESPPVIMNLWSSIWLKVLPSLLYIFDACWAVPNADWDLLSCIDFLPNERSFKDCCLYRRSTESPYLSSPTLSSYSSRTTFCAGVVLNIVKEWPLWAFYLYCIRASSWMLFADSRVLEKMKSVW